MLRSNASNIVGKTALPAMSRKKKKKSSKKKNPRKRKMGY